MKRLIIFDVDGTLLDTERIYMDAWAQAGAQAGYSVPREALLQTRAVTPQIAMGIFRRFCGEDFPYEQLRLARVQISEQIIENTPAQALRMPQALEVLQWLKEQGCLLAAASSTGYEKTCDHLSHGQLLQLFDVVVGGDMVEKGKPSPDIFLAAAARVNMDPRDCLVVGDTPADVLAASNAGMQVVLIPDQVPANSQTTALSWKVLSSLSQLPQQLQ